VCGAARLVAGKGREGRIWRARAGDGAVFRERIGLGKREKGGGDSCVSGKAIVAGVAAWVFGGFRCWQG
jgi:hypothetical protein